MDSIRAIFDTTLMCQDPTLENFNMNIRIYIFFTYIEYKNVFFVLSTFFIIGLVDGIRYHGGKYGFHLGFGHLGAPFIGLFNSNINIDPTIFQSIKRKLADPFLGFFHHCLLQVYIETY